MNRGYSFVDTQTSINISSRKQRLMAVKAMVVLLERISNAERRQMKAVRDPATSGRRCESELIASIIDEAIFILDTLQ